MSDITEDKAAQDINCGENPMRSAADDTETPASDAGEIPHSDLESVDCDESDDFSPAFPEDQAMGNFELPQDILRIISENFPGGNAGMIMYLGSPEDFSANEYRRAGEKRTLREAKSMGKIADVPEKMAIITSKDFQNALSFNKYILKNKKEIDDDAHMQLIYPAIARQLQFQDGRLKLNGVEADSINLEQYYDDSHDSIAKVDLATLHCLYTIILGEIESQSKRRKETLERMLKDTQFIGRYIRVYVRDLLRMTGYKSNNSYETETNLIHRIEGYSTILGMISDSDNSSDPKRPYPMMIMEEYNAEYGTVCFASPYMRVLAIKLLLNSLNKGSKPCHSFRIRPDIAKNYGVTDIQAFEIVSVVVRLVAQSGGFPPHIKWSSILGRCPCLENTLAETGPTNKNNVLKRAFERAWRYLARHTDLASGYYLPNPNDIKYIPTMKCLDEMIEIPHKKKPRKE